ncbi:nucleoside recognition domain protein [Thermosinus carboxydivorans Nor1]|uniref:Nucleoside recognition domain protein n=1 Tax=Thermosinus carboxydivorans Nor1 TaxID=401526 RepID=A1HLS6_9FIRM|nr:nucleoside recognition domain-containing protein [Thermosinus carboxydivorans]EAX48781.1 nucleoside recognition domain protein [Thermosinus carboxydivorans Nor1]
MSQPAVNTNKSFVEVFMEGARKGFTIAANQIAPALIFAFVLIEILNQTGLMKIIGTWTAPLMAPFGLPGAASVALISAFFSKAAGASAAADLYRRGLLTAQQATILYPGVILMGTLIGHYVRIVIVAGTNPKYHPLMFAICLLDAAIGMLLMRLFI